jgi:hypothetical protein
MPGPQRSRRSQAVHTVGAMVAVAVLAAGAATPAAAAPVVPVPGLPDSAYSGHPATAHPVRGVRATPQNPYLAANGDSGIHDDGWQTNTYRRPGPLGRNTTTISSAVGGECGSITFDRAGRIIATCIGESTGLYLIDPTTLATLGHYPLPGRDVQSIAAHPNPFNDFSGGGYFYLDNHDRAVIATRDGHVLVIAENPTATGFVLRRDYDVSGALRSGETLNSVLPDSTGRLWFVAKTDGVVGTVAPRTGRIHVVRLGNGSAGEIENSFAVGTHRDVYIATNRRLYRFTANHGGRPTVVWSVRYRTSGQTKPGQVDDGTGTTPALLPGGYVAITDNADPMDVVVYRAADRAPAGRQVCAVPVFGKGASDTENSLIAAGRSLVVENNYGYSDPSATAGGRTTTPGFARVDINADGRGCHLVWTNRALAAPSVVPKLSLATGLIYAYTKGTDPTDRWSWTALNFRTGRLVWSRANGDGVGYNNNYAGLTLGRHHAAYLGVLGGITALRDGD